MTLKEAERWLDYRSDVNDYVDEMPSLYAQAIIAELRGLRSRLETSLHNETEIRKHLACRIAAADAAHARAFKAEGRAKELEETVRGMAAWIQTVLDTKLQSRGHCDPSGHPHGYTVAVVDGADIADWELRRKLDDCKAVLGETKEDS